jgi:hypothetical protein
MSLPAKVAVGGKSGRSADELIKQIEELREPIEKTLLDILGR